MNFNFLQYIKKINNSLLINSNNMFRNIIFQFKLDNFIRIF